MATAIIPNDNDEIPPLPGHSSSKEWIHFSLISCEQCLNQVPEHFDEMLTHLFKATGRPDKKFIYRKLIAIVNNTFQGDEQIVKEIHRQVRRLLNEHFTDTAQHVCLSNKSKLALQSIANELALLPELFSLDKDTKMASFYPLERFADVSGQVDLKEYGRQAIQSSKRHSSAMLRGRNLYTFNSTEHTFEISLQIEYFHSTIGIGICSDNVSPNDIEQGSNTFPIDPSRTSREGDIFHLLIDVEEYSIYLSNSYCPKKYQNSEQKKRHRTISRRKCPLPWRFFVILTGRSNEVRIGY